MEVKELRVGNWIQSKLNPKLAFGITDSGPWKVLAEDIEPISNNEKDYFGIPLTEEWLVKFGFKNSAEIKWHKGMLGLTNFGHRIEWIIDDDRSVFLKHVHQLQNLYFALTGEELEVK